jgi:hypothetical protein
MVAKNKQTDLMHSAESSARGDSSGATEAGLKGRPEAKAHDRKLFLLILLMILLALQGAALLLNSHFIDGSSESHAVKKTPVTEEEIKTVASDLRVLSDKLNKESELALQDEPPEIKRVEMKPVPVPVAPTAPVLSEEMVKPEKKIAEPEKKMLVKNTPPIPKPVNSGPIGNNKVLIQPAEKMAVAVKPVLDKQRSYKKYDSNGVLLKDNTPQWTCVYDMYNGLMWETNSADDVMRYSKNLYSWFDPQSKSFQGVADGGRCKGDSDCDTASYVQAMNKQNYCGHNDWRLPTREQMQTLVYLDNGNENVKINKQYFPQTMPSWYWTSSENSNRDELAWYVLFRNGSALNDLKERPKHIRLVRMSNIKSIE